jgi:transposase
MKVELILSLPEGLEVTDIDVIDGVLTISAVSTHTSACCPLCSSLATRIHGHYTRTIADLPCAGQPVRRLLHVRKFFCEVTTCARKIFVERIAPFVEPWARVTTRLSESVQVIGLATGGMLGARVTDRLGIQTCPIAILRRMMALPTAPVEQVVELGIDDFAFRRGRKFGSILVDMQSHQVIDLLPDRKAETAKAWMKGHPEIKLVSRDRGGEYAAGARQGAPQAIQTADRFHLYKNLVEAVELALARCRTEIRNGAALAFSEEERKGVEPLSLPTEFVAVENWKPAPDACTERERLTRRAERHDRYEQVTALRLQGLGNAEIARRVGLTARTLQNWQKKGSFPEAARRRKRPSRFDPYACYVLSRWEQGCQNGSLMRDKLREVNPPAKQPRHFGVAPGGYNAALDLSHTALRAESEGERYTGVLHRPTLAFALRV